MSKNIKNTMRTSGLVLFSCGGLLLSGGIILGGTVAWSLLRMSYYFWTTDLGVELSSSVYFIAGSLLCLPTCWLSTLVPYHNKSISMNVTLMGLVSVGMLMLSHGGSSMSALTRAVREPTAVNSSMHRSMTIEAFDPAVRNALAAMQIELRCCGVQSYNDWYQYHRHLPPACCGRMWSGKSDDFCEVPGFGIGCLRPALAELRYFANTLSAISSALVLVMSVTLFAAAFNLVGHEVERGKAAAYKGAPLRIGIACLSQPPPRVALVEPAPPALPLRAPV